MSKVRIKPNEQVRLGTVRVENETANSIMVQLDKQGVLKVTDCCLEEQSK